MDIGGHRFFSKNDSVMDFWQNILPIQNENLHPENVDKILLIRKRLSRIYFLKQLFDYPLTLSWNFIQKLGFVRCFKIGVSYLKALIFPYQKVDNLEKFYINRFGSELYHLFFKDYTHKVWGKKPSELSPDWGAQRVKGLSIFKAIYSALKFKNKQDLKQKNVETSLIEQFLYPKFGPGQLWESLAEEIVQMGGKINLNSKITQINFKKIKNGGGEIASIVLNETPPIFADFFISTMPIKDLFLAMDGEPKDVVNIASQLEYRDFITVGVLLDKMPILQNTKDNWIYIQEPDVRVARLQFFHNWSEYMLKNRRQYFIGMEYMCFENDDLWSKTDSQFCDFAKEELKQLGFAQEENILKTHIVRVHKAYPSYSGVYGNFHQVRDFLDTLPNLYVCGRNGMHRYNNMDHSMLSAFEVANCIIQNKTDKSTIWQVNAEEAYHEEIQNENK